MLELKFIRENREKVTRGLADKGVEADLDSLLELDEKRRSLLAQSEQLKAQRNKANQAISRRKAGSKPDPKIIAEMKELSGRIKELDGRLAELEPEIESLQMGLPNLPHQSVPSGRNEKDNVEIKKCGEAREFAFEPRPHWEIGEELGILDGRRASKLSGSGFMMFTGVGALLERALINFMLEMHTTRHGYHEVLPPFIVNRACMTGTG